ncbi:aminopeptidase P family protein [Parvularcula sp. ZS-1/3]|uniref:Aminopeptidase P family protein n=1 Tax=Parvularcula mediterranea TaxID=2732508 RepID=A0A7Y3RQV3_9PROT|nr:Xaa-Pro peptidase family protein [Parvularcula mediterranea]NNU17712.1 aminopeptidase P family protein [Parvularcula mediterranea]
MIDKRTLLKSAGALAVAGAAAPLMPSAAQNIAASAKPITRAERMARLAKVQGLMRASNVRMLVIEPGASMIYFSGLRWWRSERPTLLLIPAEGEVGVVTPFFEEPSVQETIGVPASVRTWNENEDPFAVVRSYADDWKVGDGEIGIEESVRFFIADGIRTAIPSAKVVPGAPYVRACRMFKSPAELALMQVATDVTLAAYRDVHAAIEPGMRQQDVSALMSQRTRHHGGNVQFSMVLLNDASAYPHGTDAPQTVKEGGIVLMDCGCAVHDYESDVSRTFVLGEPTKKQREVWETVKRGQEIALENALVGREAGSVDRAVRSYYESLGWGPRYQTPGLSHRLGHGIGMEGHEPINLVESETMELAPGMCFSNEPGLYTFGEFGVRLEDCFAVTEDGPKLFSPLSKSITEPV